MGCTMEKLSLSGKNILITGASSGIGKSVAVLASHFGAKIALVGRNEDTLYETQKDLEGDGHLVFKYDLNDLDGIPDFVRNVANKIGPISGLVHSAGFHITKPLRIMQPADFQELLNVNVVAAMALAKGVRHKKVRAENLSIVFLSSVMGMVGQPGVSAYSASKGAIVTLTKSLALELASENIRVNCIAPGVVMTEMAEKLHALQTDEQVQNLSDMHPLGFGEPEDVAYAAHYLLSPASRWVTGSTMVVDGGYTAA